MLVLVRFREKFREWFGGRSRELVRECNALRARCEELEGELAPLKTENEGLFNFLAELEEESRGFAESARALSEKLLVVDAGRLEELLVEVLPESEVRQILQRIERARHRKVEPSSLSSELPLSHGALGGLPIHYDHAFLEDFEALPESERRQILKSLGLFSRHGIFYPALQARKTKRKFKDIPLGVCTIRGSRDLRIFWERVQGAVRVIRLARKGDHGLPYV